ncbi:HAD hydrolase-like protein [Streptomyces anulatus]
MTFFEHVIEATPAEPGEIPYVGDRLDNDIRPALQAGLLTALIRRGPWGGHNPAARSGRLSDHDKAN